jgi:hypothetical protein
VSIERYGAYRAVAIGCRNGYMQVTIVREAGGQTGGQALHRISVVT